MKNIVITIILVIGFSSVFAQRNKEETDLIKAVFGMEKKAVVYDFIEADDMHKDAFWIIYDKYETKRKEYGKERLALLNGYAQTYRNMTNDQADVLMTKVIKLQARTDKLRAKYYKKMKNATDARLAAKWYQIEVFIFTVIRMEVLEDVPFLD